VDKRHRSARCDSCNWWVGLATRRARGSFVYRRDNHIAGPGTDKAGAFPHVSEMDGLYRRAEWNATWACEHCLPALWKTSWEAVAQWLNPPSPAERGRTPRDEASQPQWQQWSAAQRGWSDSSSSWSYSKWWSSDRDDTSGPYR
jgi:hypothetical protein